MARPGPRAGAVRRPLEEAGRKALRWRFLAEVYGELRKSVWPGREEAIRLTLLVIAISVAVGIALGVVDYIFSLVVNRLLLGG